MQGNVTGDVGVGLFGYQQQVYSKLVVGLDVGCHCCPRTRTFNAGQADNGLNVTALISGRKPLGDVLVERSLLQHRVKPRVKPVQLPLGRPTRGLLPMVTAQVTERPRSVEGGPLPSKTPEGGLQSSKSSLLSRGTPAGGRQPSMEWQGGGRRCRPHRHPRRAGRHRHPPVEAPACGLARPAVAVIAYRR